MCAYSIKQFAIVRSDSADDFEQQLNDKLMNIRTRNPEVTFSETGSYMIARIGYMKEIEIEDTPIEEKGIKFRCGQCPIFKPILTERGTVDKRCKYGDCPHALYGRTYRDSLACPLLYTMIANGNIRLTLIEDPEDNNEM